MTAQRFDPRFQMIITRSKIIVGAAFLIIFGTFLYLALYWNEIRIKYNLYRISRTQDEDAAREHMKKIEEVGVSALPILWDYFLSDERRVRFGGFSFPLYFIESACILKATENESLHSKSDLADEYIPKILHSRAAQERIIGILTNPQIDFNLRRIIWHAFRSTEYGLARYAEDMRSPDIANEDNEKVRAFWLLIQWKIDSRAFRENIRKPENRKSELVREIASYISYDGPRNEDVRAFDAGAKTFREYLSGPSGIYPGNYY